jgi:hypothetical protein
MTTGMYGASCLTSGKACCGLLNRLVHSHSAAVETENTCISATLLLQQNLHMIRKKDWRHFGIDQYQSSAKSLNLRERLNSTAMREWFV